LSGFINRAGVKPAHQFERNLTMIKSRKTTKYDYSKIDIDKLLEQRRLVAVMWNTEDVLNVRPDLNDDQAWEVLKECRDKHDCELGFNWNLIECVAGMLFPEPCDKQSVEETE